MRRQLSHPRQPPTATRQSPFPPATFHILLSLARAERHGYGIMSDVAESTEGEVRIGPGTLYGTIKRLLAAGLIEESDERQDPALDDARRRYYRITAAGREAVSNEAHRLAACLQIARASGLVISAGKSPA